jgi:hypothetical protein
MEETYPQNIYDLDREEIPSLLIKTILNYGDGARGSTYMSSFAIMKKKKEGCSNAFFPIFKDSDAVMTNCACQDPEAYIEMRHAGSLYNESFKFVTTVYVRKEMLNCFFVRRQQCKNTDSFALYMAADPSGKPAMEKDVPDYGRYYGSPLMAKEMESGLSEKEKADNAKATALFETTVVVPGSYVNYSFDKVFPSGQGITSAEYTVLGNNDAVFITNDKEFIVDLVETMSKYPEFQDKAAIIMLSL